jgi:hypothetical protein
MKKILLSMAAVGALAAAAPAAAQYSNVNAGGAVGISNRIANLETQIDAGIRSGSIDRNEASRLRSELWEIRRLERRYSSNGLSVQERSDLQARIRDLRQDIRLAGGGSMGNQYGNSYDDGIRYDRYGRRDDRNGEYDRNGNRIGRADVRSDQYGNRYDDGIRYDRYGRRDDRNGEYDRNGNRIGRADSRSDQYGNRYDDGIRYDRYGRRDDRNGEYDRNGNRIGRAGDGYYGRGGPYENEDVYDDCRTRGGIGGVLDNVLGRNNCGTTLRVGARASGDLRALPSEYRYRYRDGNGVYYRHDGRSIYEIDARTNVIVRIYPMDR